MKGLIIFSLITLFTGNPLLALAVIVIIYFFIDRRFIGLLPDFAASWRRRMRISELERIVRANPHNGDALLELGVHYFERGKFRNAVDVLETFIFTWGLPFMKPVTGQKGLWKYRKQWI